MISSVKNGPHDAFPGFLEQDLNTELLRFTTAGSVDDGKSTLIGRLLHDSKAVYEDQLASVKKSRINRSTGPIDFSLLTDGLRPNASRASPSTWLTVISRPLAANLSSPTRRA